VKRAPYLCIALLGLSACAVGPNYQTPATPASGQGGFVSTAPGVASADKTPDDWWRLYDDPVLDRLIRQAFAANTDIRTAEGNLAAARGILDQARAGLFPSTALSVGDSYGRHNSSSSTITGAAGAGAAGVGSTVSGGGTGGASTGTGVTSTGGSTSSLAGNPLTGTGPAPVEWLFDASYDVSYELDLFGRVRRSIEATRGDYQAQQAALDAVRITVAAETARAYADGCAYQEEVDAANRALTVVQSTYDITLKQRDAGSSSDFDVARAAALLEQAEAAVPTLEAERRSSLFELAALLGVTPSEVPPDAAACKVAPKILAVLPVGDGAALLKRRPDVREAERHLAAETARIGVAKADLFPTVIFGGSLSTVGGPHSNLASNSNASWGVGPIINWSVPNVLVARGEIIAAKGSAKAALASFDGTVLTALKETEQALATYNGELVRHAALTRGLNDSRRAFKLAQERYQAGAIAYLDLLTTEQTLITAESNLAASDEAVAADQIQVFKALGGGWQTAAAVPAKS
jgi:NodT family efflux transporter outer membrane factor (OMF) lipoprotein